MTNQFSKRTVIGVVLMIFSLMANAQTFIKIADADKEYVLIKTDNKESYVGYIADETKEAYTIQTDEGNIIFVEKSTIKSQLSIAKENIVNGEYWAPNPNINIVTSNAFGLKKGEGYYQNNFIVVNSVGYGITDNVSMSAGFESISLLAGDGLPVFFVSSKYSKSISDKITLGASGTIVGGTGSSLSESESNSAFGIVSGLATFGTKNRNITAGVHYATGEQGANMPIFSLASQFRISKRIAFLSDIIITRNQNQNGLWGSDSRSIDSNAMLGLRFLGDNVVIDASIWLLPEMGIGIPMMSARIPFGKRS